MPGCQMLPHLTSSVKGLLDLEKHFAFYGAYHSNPTNVLIHTLFVWPIFCTSLILFHFTTPLLNLPSWLGGDVLALNLGFVFAAIFGMFYVFMDRKAGSLAAVLCILRWIGSGHHARRLGSSLAWKIPPKFYASNSANQKATLPLATVGKFWIPIPNTTSESFLGT